MGLKNLLQVESEYLSSQEKACAKFSELTSDKIKAAEKACSVRQKDQEEKNSFEAVRTPLINDLDVILTVNRNEANIVAKISSVNKYFNQFSRLWLVKQNFCKNLEAKIQVSSGMFTHKSQNSLNELHESFDKLNEFFEIMVAEKEDTTRKLNETFFRNQSEWLNQKASTSSEQCNKKREQVLNGVRDFMNLICNSQHRLQKTYFEENSGFTQAKLKLENNLSQLQETLENVKATVLLNTEKLDYNFRVLSEREEENARILNAQKRRLTKLKDSLSKNMKNFNSMKKKFLDEHKSLTEEFEFICRQESQLKEKIHFFAKADKSSASNLNTIQTLKILQAEKEASLIFAWFKEENFSLGSISEKIKVIDGSCTSNSNDNTCNSSFNEQKEKIINELRLLIRHVSDETPWSFLGFSSQNDANFTVLLKSLCCLNEKQRAMMIEDFVQCKGSNIPVISKTEETSENLSAFSTQDQRLLSDWEEIKSNLETELQILKQKTLIEQTIAKYQQQNQTLEKEILDRLSDPHINKLLVPPEQALNR